jgi:hypothetical protein
VTGPAGCAAGGAAPKPDTPVRGPMLPPLEPGGSGRDSTRSGNNFCGSGVLSAGPVFKKPEPAGGAGQDSSLKAGLPVPGRGLRSAPGSHWPGQGQAAQDFGSTAPSTSLGGNRAPGPV